MKTLVVKRYLNFYKKFAIFIVCFIPIITTKNNMLAMNPHNLIQPIVLYGKKKVKEEVTEVSIIERIVGLVDDPLLPNVDMAIYSNRVFGTNFVFKAKLWNERLFFYGILGKNKDKHILIGIKIIL